MVMARSRWARAVPILFTTACVVVAAHAATPDEILAGYAAKAGAAPSAERGQKLFNTNFGRDYAGCAACHGAVPTRNGTDLAREKTIKPMAPAFNPARFTDAAKVENLFRLNCRDVIGRECTALEKADLMTWLISLKP